MTPDAPPLARLFAIAYRSLVDGLHERLREQGWTDVRPAFGFVLLAARGGPTTSTELAILMGTTKQAASKLVDTMTAAGYVRRATPAGDARRRPVELTPRGDELLTAVEVIYADLEAAWAATLGDGRLELIRTDLVKVLAGDDGKSLPPVRPTWCRRPPRPLARGTAPGTDPYLPEWASQIAGSVAPPQGSSWDQARALMPGVASSRHLRGPHRSTAPLRSSHLRGTLASMTDDRIWTAEELERLSPDERDRIVKEGIITDLSQVPADFLARARAKGRALLEERGVITTDGS